MSVYMQNESTNRGSGDTMVDGYCNSLNILKEKVMALLEHYHTVIVQKMECDMGNLLTYNAEGFKSHLADVFCQLNEVEFQLNNLEAWAGLPPECFTPAAMNYSGAAIDHDQVSYEAQTLVEAIQHLQKELRGMVTKTVITKNKSRVNNDSMLTTSSTNDKNDNYRNSTPSSSSSLTNTMINQSPVSIMPSKTDNTSYFHPSSMNISPSIDDTSQKQYSDTALPLPPQGGPSCFSSNEENHGYPPLPPHSNNRPVYSSYPNNSRQQPNISSSSSDVYRPSSGQHSSVSPSIIPTQQQQQQHYVPVQYNQYLSSSSGENIPSNRMSSEGYPQQTQPLGNIPRTGGEQYPPPRPTQ